MYIFWFANISVAQKQGYVSEFQSEQQIRNYYASNIALLDPLEGEYDIDGAGEYITPFVHQYYPHNKYKIYIVCNNNKFKVYAKADGDFSDSYFRIEPIGETNAYWMYFHSTATRIYLQDNLHFAANFNLDHASAKKFTGNNRLSPSVNILLTNDCVKVYPTASMYAAAAKKKKEEMQPQEWTGTGFALTNNYIVTNNHVIDGAKSISIQGINGDFSHKYNAEVVATDKINDLALLKVSGANISTSNIPYAVKTNTAEVGEEIFVLGYPLTSTMGEEIKLTTGVISSKTGFQGDVSIYQISAPIQPGNSGGPLFDSKGNVVGIVSAKHTGAENVGYAIKTSYLRNLMESAIFTNILPQTNRIAGQNLSGKVKTIKNYVYYITCNSDAGVIEPYARPDNGQNITPKSTYEKFITAAKNGDLEAQFIIGVCFHTGDGIAKDFERAAFWWQLGADQGDASCMFNLGQMCIKGEGVNQDIQKGSALVKKAAENGMSDAQSYLAVCFRDGIGVPKDMKQAVYWWEKAATQGNVSSQVNLGVCYANGYGVAKDNTLAKYWWEKAASQGDKIAKKNLESLNENTKPSTTTNEKDNFINNIDKARNGDPIAQLEIGICYQKGDGVEKDEIKAFEWFEQSARQGNADAQTCLGLCYGMGMGVQKDFDQAIKWWRKAAYQGHPQAQYYLGNCYNHGTGVSVDYTHAALWYQKAAEQGNADAQFMIGVFYSIGRGVQESSADAASWWLKSAVQGNSDAQYMIGVCYENGEGVEKDGNQATYWYEKAAKQGQKDAIVKIKQK